jgi:sRNA-binding carbon storage regulator CsrA
MLALTIKDGERVYVGDNVVITLQRIPGKNAVRLVFDAPLDVVIDRESVRKAKWNAIEAEAQRQRRTGT